MATLRTHPEIKAKFEPDGLEPKESMPSFIIRYLPFNSSPMPSSVGEDPYHEEFVYGGVADAEHSAVEMAASGRALASNIYIYSNTGVRLQIVAEQTTKKAC